MGDRRAGRGRPVNLNSATKEELSRVRGISERQVEHILRYRKTHGRFSYLEDLHAVSGCEELPLDELHYDVTVGRRPARG